MSTSVTLNGTTYQIPAEGDFNWGTELSNYFIAISTAVLQKTGGTFTLTSEVNFGATYGIKSAYLKSQAANPASAGIIRLGNAENISWRNQANNADLGLTVNASNQLAFNSTKVILSGAIVNADVDAAAAIAYSKLNLSGSIVNADVSASAAIAYSKLNLATSIVNADIAALAAIDYSKLAALTASRVLVSDGSGVVSASSVTSTTLGYLDATSSIQTQLNAKAPSASPTFTGTVTLPATITGASAQVLTFPTSTSTFATLGLNETFTGTKTLQSLTVTTNPLTLTVGQIAFPATQNASADANTLDDYEEGTFTPTVYGSSTAGTSTYSTQLGSYIKIGQIVWFSFTVQITNQTGTGNIRFGGLPFTSISTQDMACSVKVDSLTFSNQLIGQVVANNTIARFLTISTGAGSAEVAIDTAFTANFVGCYRTTA